MAANELTKQKDKLFNNVKLRLGDRIVDVELDREHLEVALENAVGIYHQLSSNAMEESYAFLSLEKDKQEYILDDNILEVRQIFRRSIGSSGDSASSFEPFEAGYMNMYMLRSGRMGGLLTYELFTGYQELAARMFGGFINFMWNSVTKKLTLIRRIEADGEQVLLWIYNRKPVEHLLTHHMSKKWMEDCTLAHCKIMLGEARSKFSTLAGPQGGTTMNGSELKTEGTNEILDLKDQLMKFVDGGQPYGFILG